ncbi:acireductone synthase [Acetobacter sp. AN02]|uniref:acireductone synthase n=1 Tax=Acetobacter sp. AN02 TaxID=2894186 RepID=UPI0024345CF2|nr:acireductone synthase [Acetobacter sp. AN02]MDG6094822.1 acireductone synthase [Acetobacter sp. AN02]
MTAVPSFALLDIEGTTLPVSFVHKVLFPYARKALPGLIHDRADDPVVKSALAEIRREFPDQELLQQLFSWMDQDAKVAPLKALQGLAWEEGYASGDLEATLFPDVPGVLKAWQGAGIGMAVYSSGSAKAQKLIYRHTTDGDLTGLFSAFIDLEAGGKKDPASYRRIREKLECPAEEIVFFSDVVAELDAAREAGFQTCQIARPEDGTVPGTGHPVAPDLAQAARLCGLPDA